MDALELMLTGMSRPGMSTMSEANRILVVDDDPDTRWMLCRYLGKHAYDMRAVEDGEQMGSLFRGLEGLEAMVAIVRETGEAPPPQPELVESLRSAAASAELPDPHPEESPEKSPEKKALS